MVVRWVLWFIIVLSIVQILGGFYMIKHGPQITGLKMVIGGSFFLLVSYAASWLARN